MAPGDRVPQRLLALGQITWPAGQKLEPVRQTRQHLRGCQQLRPGSGQLNRERQTVQPPADLDDDGDVLRGQLERRSHGGRALDE
jgi:hypothetical protein